jgi:signal transduction histidine kinase
MTQDILDLAKLKAGRLILRKSPSEVPELVRESLRVMEGAAQGLQVRLESEVEPGLPPVMVDPTLIVRVLVNLVANSLRFTPEDGRVLVGAGPRDGSVEITVMDTGVGIPPQHIGSLFTRFTQVPDTMGASRQGMGTGLGLAICKEIVNAHGGSISATSKVGEGTTVRFTLPIR